MKPETSSPSPLSVGDADLGPASSSKSPSPIPSSQLPWTLDLHRHRNRHHYHYHDPHCSGAGSLGSPCATATTRSSRSASRRLARCGNRCVAVGAIGCCRFPGPRSEHTSRSEVFRVLGLNTHLGLIITGQEPTQSMIQMMMHRACVCVCANVTREPR